MRGTSLLLFLFFCCTTKLVYGQVASDCTNAIPICNNTPVNGGTLGFGSDDFTGSSTSGCLEQTSTGTIESNSAWYRFRTNASGQLGINIGFDTSEDWDFALYRSDNCTNLGEPIRCNFFDNSEQQSFMGIGEHPGGIEDTVLYEDWLEVSPGEEYYILINNFSQTNSGFSIQFSGQIFETNPYDALDCSIISNLLGPPIAACDTQDVQLDATVSNALSYSWYLDVGNGFNEIQSETSPIFQVAVSGMYRVVVEINGGSQIISDVQVAFNDTPIVGDITDETVCLDNGPFQLNLKDEEALSGQDGNEVLISYHLGLDDAILGYDPIVNTQTLPTGATDIFVRATSIANPMCFDASGQFQITTIEGIDIAFPTEVFLCEDVAGISIGPPNALGDYTYLWSTGEQTPQIQVEEAGEYTVLIRSVDSPEVCSIERRVTVIMSQTPEIIEVKVNDLQVQNQVEIVSNTDGGFLFKLDDGPYQNESIFLNVLPGIHQITILDPKGCGSVSDTITVVGFLPFFTPNGDGVNDLWYIHGLHELEAPMVELYDKYGKLLTVLSNNDKGWDGRYNGRELPSSDYWFKLSYLDATGERVVARHIRNHFSLKR